MKAYVEGHDEPWPIRVQAAARCCIPGDCPTQYRVCSPSRDWLRVWCAIGEGNPRFYVTYQGAARAVQLVGRWKESADNYTWTKRS